MIWPPAVCLCQSLQGMSAASLSFEVLTFPPEKQPRLPGGQGASLTTSAPQSRARPHQDWEDGEAGYWSLARAWLVCPRVFHIFKNYSLC